MQNLRRRLQARILIRVGTVIASTVVIFLTAYGGMVLGQSLTPQSDRQEPPHGVAATAITTHAGAHFGADSTALANALKGEASTLLARLQLIDAPDPCAGQKPCTIDQNFSSVMDVLLIRCERLGPDSQGNAPGYQEAVHGRIVAALKSACGPISQTSKRLGAPADTPEWRQVYKTALAALSKVEADLK